MNTSSILRALGVRKRVLLRDEGHEESPVLRVSSPEAPPASTADRYHIVGEIARGGIGVVLKGRDVDLGRDVAMKVLRPEHARDTGLVERFIEEAQIEGQLQHPGIVPVYELGLRDRQPYLTMKLVRGQTLAALLAARMDPAQDHRRLLGIFSQVCETVAYAHARGVLHRDLKPSNVMVGAFGEVLVVDWGLAKVLRQEEPQRDLSVVRTRRAQSGSASLAGAVVGTPAYMPPEQALGEAASVDTRADVFALGAILCEILTGAPPYRGVGSDPLLQASRAEVEDAFARLEACGAEPELVAIAKACLAPLRADRPADAGIVANRVADHLAAVEERARRAQVEAAEATARARGDRKARRLTIALASAVAFGLVAGGLGWWRIESDRRDRVEARAARVREALAVAAQRRGEAQGLDLAKWAEASGAANAAVALARAPDTPDALRGEAERFAAHVEREAAAAGAQAERDRRDAEAVERLTEIRSRGGDTFNRHRSDEDFAEIFRDCIGDISSMTPERAAGRIAESAIRREICAALDDWASLRTATEPVLLAVLAAADPDPWRTQVREAARDRDPRRLGTLARAADPAETSAQSLTLLASALTAAGDMDAAIALLRRSAPHHPHDLWVHVFLARWLSAETVRDFEPAIRHHRAALALHPRSTELRHFLGIALSETGRYDEAIAVWRDALSIDPSFVHMHDHIFEIERARGALGRRITALLEEVRTRPDDAELHLQLGLAYRLQWDWRAAAAELQRAVEIDPDCGIGTRLMGAIALAHSGRGSEAREARGAIEAMFSGLARARQTSALWEMLGRLRQLTGDPAGAVEAFREAIDLMPDRGASWNWLSGALVQKGDLGEAMRACREALARGGPTPGALDVADALARAGRREEAVAFCREVAPLLHKEIDRAPEGLHRPRAALGAILCEYLEEYDAAIEVLREAVEADAQDLNARLCLGTAFLRKADAEAAADAFEDFLVARNGPRGHLGRGHALRQLGRVDEAIAHFREARDLGWPDSDTLDASLGWLLLAGGRTEEGLACLRRCAERNGTPQERWEMLSATATRAAPKLPAALRGEPVLADARELLLLGRMCDHGGRFAAAADLYRRAFELDPSLREEPAPFAPPWRAAEQAACAAVLGGTGRGTGAPADGAELRRLALAWLGPALSHWRGQIDGDRDAVRAALWAWKLEPSLAPVRYGPHLALLPEAEKAVWQAFWQEVEDVLARTRP